MTTTNYFDHTQTILTPEGLRLFLTDSNKKELSEKTGIAYDTLRGYTSSRSPIENMTLTNATLLSEQALKKDDKHDMAHLTNIIVTDDQWNQLINNYYDNPEDFDSWKELNLFRVNFLVRKFLHKYDSHSNSAKKESYYADHNKDFKIDTYPRNVVFIDFSFLKYRSEHSYAPQKNILETLKIEAFPEMISLSLGLGLQVIIRESSLKSLYENDRNLIKSMCLEIDDNDIPKITNPKVEPVLAKLYDYTTRFKTMIDPLMVKYLMTKIYREKYVDFHYPKPKKQERTETHSSWFLPILGIITDLNHQTLEQFQNGSTKERSQILINYFSYTSNKYVTPMASSEKAYQCLAGVIITEYSNYEKYISDLII